MIVDYPTFTFAEEYEDKLPSLVKQIPAGRVSRPRPGRPRTGFRTPGILRRAIAGEHPGRQVVQRNPADKKGGNNPKLGRFPRSLAEREGFEPSEPFGSRALQARALGRTMLPLRASRIIPPGSGLGKTRNQKTSPNVLRARSMERSY
jgi:hypothetical protein